MTGSELQTRFEIVAHTADFGIRGQAPTLASLFEVMARGLFHLIAEGEEPAADIERHVRVSADSEAALLRAWLREINGLHHEHQETYGSFSVSINGNALEGRIRGEPNGPHHGIQHEVKGITWHDLEVTRVPGGRAAFVVVDV